MPRHKSAERPLAEHSVRIHFEGKTYEAAYTVDGPIVAINSTKLGSKSALRGGIPPDALATIMLTELVYQDQERNQR